MNEIITQDEQKTILRANEIINNIKYGVDPEFDTEDDIQLILQVLVNIIEKLKDRIKNQSNKIQEQNEEILEKTQELNKEHEKVVYQNAKIDLLKDFLGGNEWLN